ncbi:MAG TPA: hypothetical protein VFN08_14265 [Gemmatimonadales bacterium]|jgi:hypothetical protein|nr:hypothetical protein [Gemmatimonadales bacterium]
MRRLLALLLLASAPACGGAARGTVPGRVAPWLRADRQRCLIPRDLRENMEAMAQRCAEAFVRENGYTEAAAEDSTRWVRELDDDAVWPRVLARRSGTLASHASSVQCSMRECVVLFPVHRPMLSCAYRAVRMTQVFTRIRMTPGGIRDIRCHERQV